MQFKVTKNFKYLVKDEQKITILEGSSRSGKTVAAVQYIIYRCLKEEGLIITIARSNLVVAKRTVLLDLLQQLKGLDYTFNKSENTILLKGNMIRIVGLDNLHKVHGLQQDILYVNEGLDVSEGIYLQLLQRTTNKVIVDYNPSEVTHFLYDWEKRKDCKIHRTNIFDNPMVPLESKLQILSYEPNKENERQGTANEYYWKVYGLGLRHRSDDVVFTKKFASHLEEDLLKDTILWTYYGGDFGYTDPTTLVEVKLSEKSNTLYCRVLMYQTSSTNLEIAETVKGLIPEDAITIWDSAEPKSIRELTVNGINAYPASKKGGIYFGLQKMKQYNISLYEDERTNLLREELVQLRYVTDVNQNIMKNTKGQPIIKQGGDHCIDPIRYVLTKLNV